VAAVCKQYVVPKRLFTQALHVVTPQTTAFFIVTDVETSNVTMYSGFLKLIHKTTFLYVDKKIILIARNG
jgi:hypothetical protein